MAFFSSILICSSYEDIPLKSFHGISQKVSGREPLSTRAQRAHWRLSWPQRLARNARPPTAPPLQITLHGLPAIFVQSFGLPVYTSCLTHFAVSVIFSLSNSVSSPPLLHTYLSPYPLSASHPSVSIFFVGHFLLPCLQLIAYPVGMAITRDEECFASRIFSAGR